MHGEMTQPRIDAGGAHAGLAAWVGMFAMAILLLPALALAQAGGAPKGNPPLASLNIEIWPEYDRAAALVILKGALVEGVKLPAAITLRLPMASGGAAAVAFSATADGSLLNLKHERATAGEFITLKFETPERFFHVEFYEPIATTVPTRSFRYLWPGDLAVEHVTVVVQEPASASDISVEPSLQGASTGQDGLRYRAAELGVLAAGKPLPILVRYTKVDTRPSVEILKPKAVDVASPPAASPPATAGLPNWAIPFAGVVVFALIGAALILWLWRRESRSAISTGLTCAKCGAAQVPGQRFCGNCGAKARGP